MKRLQPAAVALVSMFAVSACGLDDPASGVATPGAPVGRDGVAAATTIEPPAVTSTTTIEPRVTTTTIAPATTPPPTTVAPTTVPPATTEAPTTTVVEVPTTRPLYKPEPIMGTLRSGVEGPRSLQLQRDLITLGFLPAGADDGQYGPGTAGGVRRFQASVELVEDGVFGPNTQAALADAIAALAAPPDA